MWSGSISARLSGTGPSRKAPRNTPKRKPTLRVRYRFSLDSLNAVSERKLLWDQVILARVFSLGLALLLPLSSAHAANTNPRILPPHTKPVRTVIWGVDGGVVAVGARPRRRPSTRSQMDSGAHCAEGQDAKVWSLGRE